MAVERSEASLKHLRTLWNEGAISSLGDRELLARFVAHTGDAAEAAFAALMERHAPMVLLVCRQMLGDEHDAQDACQATFLVLAKKARSIKKPEALGSWLHGVALRVSAKAKTAAARRRSHERQGVHMVARSESDWPGADPCPELHEEIARLPERYRLPVVLCYLEGLTHDQAARKLGWPLGTVESRLARARGRLRRRLEHRGAMPGVALLGARSLADLAKTTVSSGWIEATARSATQFAAGETAAAVASANVAFLTRETLNMMTLSQIKLAIACSLAAVAVATGVVAVVRAVPAATSQPPLIAAIQPGPPAAERAKPPEPPVAPVTIKVRGRVLDPAGRPLQGSRLWLAFQGTDWTWSNRVPEVRATSGADGRFEFTVSDNDPEVSRALRMTSGWPDGFGDIQILASADGFGPAWTPLAAIKTEIELRLVPDDIPIEGRLLTLEGHPIVGATVKTQMVEDAARSKTTFGAPSGFFQSATTDAEGRFRLTGFGRGRRVMLGFAGGGIKREEVQAVTGTFPADHPTRFRGIAQVGPKFEHLCKPGKSIEGVVRDLDTGAALPGITVRAEFGGYAWATTDQNGRYRIEGLDSSPTRRMTASARGGDQPYLTSERTVNDKAGYDTMAVDFSLLKGVVVTGRMTDRATGKPVQAWVGYAAMRDNPHWSRAPGFTQVPGIGNGYRPIHYVPAMADGSYRLVTLPGKGFLVAFIQYQSDRFLPAGVPNKRKPGAPADALDVHYDTVPFELFPSNFPAVKEIDIAPGTEAITRDLTFDSGVTRIGTVVDSEGHPLEGTTTMAGETREQFYRLNAIDGSKFTVYGLFRDPKLYRTVIFRNEARGLGTTLRVDGSDAGPINVRLDPLASLTGRLVDESGKPRKDAEMRLLRIVEEPYVGANGEFSPPLRATTDGDGRFRIDGIIPGTAYWLQTSEGRFFNRDLWTPRPAEKKDLGDITPKPVS